MDGNDGKDVSPREPGGASRVIDGAISLTLLVATAPLLLLLWGAVKSTSPGPAIFRHPRVGRDGKAFDVLKFRTMRHHGLGEVDQSRSPRYKVRLDSPAVTSVGRWLRRSGLDELPQLANVLRGEMALIGIRPMVAPELADEPAAFQSLYVRFRPGLSGLWQVEGRIAHLEHTGRTEHDVDWAHSRTLLGDLWLMLRTPMAMARGCRAAAPAASRAAAPTTN